MSNINQRLDLRQSQNLVMTPQLQQAIKLLQLSNVELAEYIESEIAQNPLLEKQPNETESESLDSSQKEERDSMQEEFDSEWTGNEADTPAATVFSLPDESHRYPICNPDELLTIGLVKTHLAHHLLPARHGWLG